MQKTKIFHFHNGSGGGVLSIIKNLINYSNNLNIENHVIYTINKSKIKSYTPEKIVGASSQQVYYYNSNNNFYYTCSQLAKLLPDSQAIIVAHDWLELGMASNLGLQNPVVQFLHGDYSYYYELAKNNEAIINSFVCISSNIYKTLHKHLPNRKVSIFQRYYPVPTITQNLFNSYNLNLLFAVRDLEDVNKNFQIIPKIDRLLHKAGIVVKWIIIGKVNTDSKIYSQLNTLKNFKHLFNVPNEALIQILSKVNIFILPSINEGLPVALVEAMKAGLVPLVTNWNNATAELLRDGENGFYIELDNAKGYAEKIEYLYKNKNILDNLSQNAAAKANEIFDPHLNTLNIESVIQNTITAKYKVAKKVYGSRLDNPLFPNFFVKILRTFKK